MNELPLIYNSVTVSGLSGWSISTCIQGLKYSNLSFVVYVLGGASTGSVIIYNIRVQQNFLIYMYFHSNIF